MRPAEAESRPEDRHRIRQFRQLVKRLFVLDNDDVADALRKLTEFARSDALLAAPGAARRTCCRYVGIADTERPQWAALRTAGR